METARDWELNTLIIELIHGKQLVNQLKSQIDPSTSQQDCEFLVQKIICSYERALSMLNWTNVVGEPQCFTSPNSEGYEVDFKDQTHTNVFKKRKTIPRWTEQVRICSVTGVEGPLDDGYSWRKYGQKDILGANFPRAYYRCTHRNVQGCLATKQVQRSDQDPSIFEITYRGRHTCMKSLKREGPKPIENHHEQFLQEEKKEQSQDELFNCVTSLEKIKTEDLRTKEEIFPSSTFMESKDVKESTFMGSYYQPFTTFESNCFNFGMDQILQTSESDLRERVSAPTSIPNSPIGDLDFSILDQVDFDPNFSFDIEFFT